jgi:hypothetical protein
MVLGQQQTFNFNGYLTYAPSGTHGTAGEAPSVAGIAAASAGFPTRPYFSTYTSNPIPFENLAS